MIISVAAKAYDKIQHNFMIKTFDKLGIEGNVLNRIKPYMKNPQLTSYSIVKDQTCPLRSGKRQNTYFH